MLRFSLKFAAEPLLVFSLAIVATAWGGPAVRAEGTQQPVGNRTSLIEPQAASSQPQDVSPPISSPPTPLSHKQKKDLLKSNIEKMKRDADELVTLTKSLQEDIDKSSENVLSLKVVDKAEKIEKLARKIRNAARGQ